MRRLFSLLLILPLLGAASPAAPASTDFFEAHPGLWSFAYLLTATVQLFVSGIGLYLIWRQLRASKEALVESSTSAQAAANAARISYTATRPWVKFRVSKVHLFFNPGNEEEVGCQVNYTIENIENTPAIQVGVLFKPLPVGHGTSTEIDRELDQLWYTNVRNPRVLFPKDRIEEGLSTNFPFPRQADESMLGFKVIAAVVYKAAPGGEVFWTPAVLGLQHETPPKDRIYRFHRCMGPVPCLALLLGDETPPPT